MPDDPALPVRVLQVPRRFYPEPGGVETHVAEITRRLSAVPGIEVSVLTTDRSGALPRHQEFDGYHIERRRSYPRRRDYYLSPGIIPPIMKGPWDVVHLQGINTLVPPVGMLAAIAGRVPFVLSMHSGGHSSPVRNAGRHRQWRLLAPLLRRAARLVAVSRFERDHFAAETGIPASRFTVIPNGGALPPVPPDVLPVRGRIISSGRLERYKGHHRVIEALPELRSRHQDAHVVVLGSGPYDRDLRRLAASYGVAGAVEFRSLPPDDRQGMARELASGSVMAAMSDYEAHPIGVMEALAIGLPVVGLDTAGIGDLVRDGLVTGLPPDSSPHALVEALDRQFTASARRARAPHDPQDVDLPTWESCTARLVDLYREVAARGRR